MSHRVMWYHFLGGLEDDTSIVGDANVITIQLDGQNQFVLAHTA